MAEKAKAKVTNKKTGSDKEVKQIVKSKDKKIKDLKADSTVDSKSTTKAEIKKSEVKVDSKTSVIKNSVKVVKKLKRLSLPKDVYYGTGKRKTSIAKVWIFKGTGKYEINGKTLLEYFKSPVLISSAKEPLVKLEMEGKYDCRITALGGGIRGQADAMRHGIARALLAMDVELKSALREKGYLTRDARIKERKKYGFKKARKGFQFRKR